jgi:hypothetical protein
MGGVLGVSMLRARRAAGRRALAFAVAAAATLILLPAHASAQTPDDSGGVDQYVEDIPTGGGSKVPGQGGKKQKKELPKQVAQQIRSQGGSDASLLDDVASSADYGAPQTTIVASRSGAAMESREGDNDASPQTDVNALDGLEASGGGSGSGRLVGLLVLIGLVSVAAFGVSGLRRRSSS